MIPIALEEAGAVMGCRPASDYPRINLPPISTDSRTAASGQAFLALQGEQFDGHDYIPQAVQKGVRVVIHRQDWQPEVRGDVFFMPVPDTTRALQDLATRVRRIWNGTVVAITGSMGKTTTRQFTAALLQEKRCVHQSAGNLNNHFGVPMTLLDVEPEHQIAVLELGMNHSGEIRRLGEVCQPDLGVITNVAAAHLEFFSSVDEIAEAKGELLESMAEGVFVYNSDDSRVCHLARNFPGRTASFGFSEGASVRLGSFQIRSLTEMAFELLLPDARLSASVPFAGRHFLYNLSAAAAVALEQGLSTDQIQAGIERLEAPAGRGGILEFVQGSQRIVVWDDSYNANPRAVESVLDTLSQVPNGGRKIAVLGDMLELGAESERMHFQVGEQVARSKIDWLVAAGPLSRETVRGAIAAGFPESRTRHFDESNSAGTWLSTELRDQDLILLKGSRGIRVEAVLQSIREGWEVES